MMGRKVTTYERVSDSVAIAEPSGVDFSGLLHNRLQAEFFPFFDSVVSFVFYLPISLPSDPRPAKVTYDPHPAHHQI